MKRNKLVNIVQPELSKSILGFLAKVLARHAVVLLLGSDQYFIPGHRLEG